MLIICMCIVYDIYKTLWTLREKLCDKLAIVEIQSYNNDDVEQTLSIHHIIFVFRVLPLSLNPGLATPNLQS